MKLYRAQRKEKEFKDLKPAIKPIELPSHTQASFNTMRYKGRDSASGIDRNYHQSIYHQLKTTKRTKI